MNNSGRASTSLSKNRPALAVADSCASTTSPDLFEDIYRSYGKLVRRVYLRTLRDPVDAEDTTKDVLVRVVLKLHTFRGEAAFSSWLYRLTINVVLMRFRKNRKSVSLDESGEVEIEAGSDPRMLKSYASDVVEAAINLSLPESERFSFFMISRDTDLGRLLSSLAIRTGTRRRNCTGLGSACASCCQPSKPIRIN
jgi:RNA polymerase sigma factor (sigma-70 family)